jgi:phosphoribosylamine--glycine ligase
VMIGPDGPKLIEFNVRFGDPECQVLMLRLMSDILPALIASADGELGKFHLRWRNVAALTVVMAARGYPGSYEKGTPIRNLDATEGDPDLVVFHAGTAARDGALVATGGRVLGVTAAAASVRAAQAKAYAAIDRIDWPGGFCRRDIGWRAIAREQGGAA